VGTGEFGKTGSSKTQKRLNNEGKKKEEGITQRKEKPKPKYK